MRMLMFLYGWCWLGQSVCAQPDSLFRLKDVQDIRSLEHWFTSIRHDTLTNELETLEAHYHKQKQPVLARYMWLARKLAWVEKAKDRSEVETRYLQLEKEVARKNWPDTEGEVWVIIGSFYAGSEQYGKAFEYSLRGYYRIDALGFDKYPHLYRHLSTIADIYYRLGDWESAIRFYRILNSLPEDYSLAGPRFHVLNTMAMAFRNLQQFDSSAHYFKVAYQSALASRDLFWMGLTQGNLGYNYYLSGDFGAAAPLLATDYNQSKAAKQWESAVNAGLSLADIYIKQNKPALAAAIMDTIEAVVLQKRTTRWMRLWFQNSYGLARANGRMTDALRYADSALKYRDMAATNSNAQLIANTRSKIEAEQYLNQLTVLESKKNRAMILRNALLAIITLGTVILLMVINRSRIRHRHALAIAAYEKKLADEKLEQVKTELDQFTMRMRDKTMLIAHFEQELNTLRQQDATRMQEQNQSLQALLEASILTEEEWIRFRELFEKVHPGFIIKLRQQFPDLTPADTRMLVLTKLRLSNKEMMAMLGIGYDAIKKARQRLRKKINMPEEDTLEAWVEKV